ncbi:MAG: hypothetical protein QF519_03130 [Candidatus Poseidoniia archaeon]|nr:hypothetical protein [Candidatus Poseidoniia archaeon]
MALTTLLTLAAETGQARFRMIILGILLLMPGAALASWSAALWSALRYAPAAAWPAWLTRSVPLLLLLLLALLGPPGLLLYWLGVWWLGRVWFRNFQTE